MITLDADISGCLSIFESYLVNSAHGGKREELGKTLGPILDPVFSTIPRCAACVDSWVNRYHM